MIFFLDFSSQRSVDYFWCSVNNGSKMSVLSQLRNGELLSHSKVWNDHSVIAYKNVVWLDVSMKKLILMQIANSFKQRMQYKFDGFFIQRFFEVLKKPAQIIGIIRIINHVVLFLNVNVDCQRRKNIRAVKRLLYSDLPYDIWRKANGQGLLVIWEDSLFGHDKMFVFLVVIFVDFSVRAFANGFYEFKKMKVVDKFMPF